MVQGSGADIRQAVAFIAKLIWHDGCYRSIQKHKVDAGNARITGG
jgi:hypothetical protein